MEIIMLSTQAAGRAPSAEAPRAGLDTSRRPLWLLDEPRALESHHDVPCYQGSLRLVSGPERIETGWWDEDGITRDYFVAINSRGMHLWIYRDRSRDKGAWFLHGMFG